MFFPDAACIGCILFSTQRIYRLKKGRHSPVISNKYYYVCQHNSRLALDNKGIIKNSRERDIIMGQKLYLYIKIHSGKEHIWLMLKETSWHVYRI
jgi:hypothetical protein